MEQNKKENKEINPLTSEHLREGVTPIIASIGTLDDLHTEEGKEVVDILFGFGAKNDTLHDADYYGDHLELIEEGFKNPGIYSYVISPISEKAKVSRGFKDCTGVVVSGVNKETGKNISFISHQDPMFFLDTKEKYQQFFHDLNERIEEMKEHCEPGTIDGVLFGGKYVYDDPEYQKKYLQSIESISGEMKKSLGFPPAILVGPKMEDDIFSKDDVYYDNENRRLHIVRPTVGNETTKSYLLEDISKQEDLWRKEYFKANYDPDNS